MPSTSAIPIVVRAAQDETVTAFIESFFRPFLRELEEYRFASVDDEIYDETMVKLIGRMKPLRDRFLQFADDLARLPLAVEDIDHLHDNLERLAQLQYPARYANLYRETDRDNYRFICYELVLGLIATLVGYGQFKAVAQLVDSIYFYDRVATRRSYAGITAFGRHYLRSIEELRKRRLQLRRVSLTADMIKERAEDSLIDFDTLMQADLLLYYLTLCRQPLDPHLWQPDVWFPRLSPFAERLTGIPVLHKLISKRHFERAKMLFVVRDPGELSALVDRIAEREATYRQGFDSFEYAIEPLARAIPIDQLALVP